jgi:holo-[acyl-carrier protein] synthase
MRFDGDPERKSLVLDRPPFPAHRCGICLFSFTSCGWLCTSRPTVMRVVGLGLDLIDLDRFRVLYGDDDPDLLARCFTAQELLDVGNDVDRLARLAARFAAKEAVFKALGGATGIAHTDIEVVRSKSGAPELRLHGAAADLAATASADRLFLTLAHSGGAAAAVVLAVSAGPR